MFDSVNNSLRQKNNYRFLSRKKFAVIWNIDVITGLTNFRLVKP